MDKKYAVGIDLGGTNMRAGLVTRDGEIVRRRKEPTTEEVLASLFAAVEILASEEIAGIGLAAAGVINREQDRVVNSPNLHIIEKIDLAGALRERFAVPVFLENDANAAALGELWTGAGKDFSSFVLFTLGTGIGGGIVYGRKLLNTAAEIGHMSIYSDGEKCPCGNSGCLESYASMRAILSKAFSTLESGRESSLRQYCGGNFYKLTTEEIYRAALDGDSLARELLKNAGRCLGIGIANVINVISPEAVILGGGLTGAWDIYVQEAMKEASRRAFKELCEGVKIIPSRLMDDAAIVGSAGLVFRSMSDQNL
jgi:glucokinase